MAGVTVPLLAEVVGRHESVVYRRLHSGLTDAESDRWACALNLHPAEVWGTAWIERPLLDEALSA
jgi:hypothetical protein